MGQEVNLGCCLSLGDEGEVELGLGSGMDGGDNSVTGVQDLLWMWIVMEGSRGFFRNCDISYYEYVGSREIFVFLFFLEYGLDFLLGVLLFGSFYILERGQIFLDKLQDLNWNILFYGFVFFIGFLKGYSFIGQLFLLIVICLVGRVLFFRGLFVQVVGVVSR